MENEEFARFETMTNVELRAELKRRGCSTSGIKKDLLTKLRSALQEECEQTADNDNSVVNPQNQLSTSPKHLSTTDQYTTPVIPTAEQLSISTLIDEQQTIEKTNATNQENILEIANNLNEVNSFVSKSNENEEEEKNVEKLGDHAHLPVIADSSKSQTDTDESSIKKNTSVDEQQQQQQQSVNQLQEPTEEIVSVETTRENESHSPIEDKSEPTQLKITRSQSNSSVKFPARSIWNKINLNLELLQTLISDVSLLSESAINDELDSDQNNDSILETSLSNDFQPTDSITIGDLADQKTNSNRTVAIDDLSARRKSNPMSVRMASFDGNGIVTDEPVRIKDPTVSNEPASEILYIRGLTRPFSLMQLKGLLSLYGTLVDGDFWLDKIKSQCVIRYKTIEDAQNARQQLDGCQWPSTNPKILSIRFARQDELEHCQTHDAPPDNVLNENMTDRIVEEKISSPDNDIPSKTHVNDSKSSNEKQRAFLIADDENIPDKDNDENTDEQPAKSNDQSAKGLDDYFRKTKAKPSIYWLPLTDEQIVERNRRQEQRKAERDEEQRKREFDENQRQNDKRKRAVSPLKRDLKRH